MAHFVYMLRCAGDRIYTGYAVDVEARFEQHKSGKGAKFTKAFPPECVLRTFELGSREEALRLEARIKKLTRSQKELLALGNGSCDNSCDSSCGKKAGDLVDDKNANGSSELEARLLAGLGETLASKKRRRKNAGGSRTYSINKSTTR